MRHYLDPNDVAAVRAEVGSRLDELSRVMLDVDTPPVFLFLDERPRLAEARANAMARIGQWVAAQPAAAHRMRSRLPDIFPGQSIAETLLVAVISETYYELPIGIFDVPGANSPVFAAAPQLMPRLDESGLVRVDGLDARPWGVHTGEYAFHYHQLLRRGFSSGIHYGLVSSVLKAADQYELTARLAIDERRLRLADEYQEIFEHDYWFGPTLTEDDLDTLTAVGETFHGDPDGGRSLLNPYAGISVRWTADGQLKVVEIEEFMPPPEDGADWVLARYLHAIRDTEKRVFVHCDGAVKAFGARTYPRTQQGFKRRGKGDRYRKVFRIDGEFPASVWTELASLWFRGNRLINEYFASMPTI